MAVRHDISHSLLTPVAKQGRSSRGSSVSDRSYNSDDTYENPHHNQDKPTRKRASKPKVRTGCISCKKRHVKCGEEKPGCARCENLGYVCEGYATPKTVKQLSRAERSLLPKPKLAPLAPTKDISHLPVQPAVVPAPPLLATPSLGFDLTDDESWYLSLYSNQVAADLAPCRGANFWTRSPLRDSMTMNSIRHSVLSIGAYARALMELQNEDHFYHVSDRPWWPISVFNRHREAALTHHALALACLRQEIDAAGVDNRTTMAATLLFIVFENMMGNYHSSGNLIRSGIRVLSNMGRTQSRECIRKMYSSEPPDEIDEMTYIFLRHSTSSILLPFPHGKSAYHMLFEDDDDELFRDSEGDVASGFSAIPNIPTTPEQAAAMWETLYPAIGRFYAKALWRNLNPNYEIEDHAFVDQALLATRLHDLGLGITSLINADETDATMKKLLACLELYQLVSTVLVACCLDRSETLYDDFTPQFMDIMARCRTCARYPLSHNKTGFTNEVGMLPVLAFVASKCRVYSVRLDALDLLRSSTCREGPWDGISLASAVGNLMQLEGQSDLDDGLGDFLPLPETRYLWTNMFWDFENRRMTMEYTRTWSDSAGDFEKVIRVVNG